MEIRDIYLRREPGPLCRSAAALVLRLGLGTMLLVQGWNKYDQMKSAPAPVVVEGTAEPGAPAPGRGMAPNEYPGWMVKAFEGNKLDKSFLTPGRVELFARVLPYAEMGLGAGLVLGLFTGAMGTLAGLLMVALLFGRVVQSLGDPTLIGQLPGMFTYLFACVATVWVSPATSNLFSLDGLIFGWLWRRGTEGGEFRPDR